ncbi:MAG: ZIP family metal transporter [Bacilli bacterium]|nr:ZIP family metal transporter [Bacilli bacterium]
MTSFIITFIAGISTIIGSFLVFYFKNINKYLINIFKISSFIIIYICLVELIPTAIKLLNYNYYKLTTFSIIFTSFIIGFFIIKLFDFKTNDQMYRVGIIATISLIIHNIPEGIITYLTTENSLKLGLKMALAIAAHNIPEGILITLPFYISTKRKGSALFYTTIAGLSELLGAVIGWLFFSNLKISYLGVMYAMVSGIMISLVFTEIFPLIKKEKN